MDGAIVAGRNVVVFVQRRHSELKGHAVRHAIGPIGDVDHELRRETWRSDDSGGIGLHRIQNLRVLSRARGDEMDEGQRRIIRTVAGKNRFGQTCSFLINRNKKTVTSCHDTADLFVTPQLADEILNGCKRRLRRIVGVNQAVFVVARSIVGWSFVLVLVDGIQRQPVKLVGQIGARVKRSLVRKRVSSNAPSEAIIGSGTPVEGR